jgi:hypothetical protein
VLLKEEWERMDLHMAVDGLLACDGDPVDRKG